MRPALLLAAALLFGCFGISAEEKLSKFNPVTFCDRDYPQDDKKSHVIGVFECKVGYRLVFEDNDHNDFYVDKKGEYWTSCPPRELDPYCRDLIKTCEFTNICRG